MVQTISIFLILLFPIKAFCLPAKALAQAGQSQQLSADTFLANLPALKLRQAGQFLQNAKILQKSAQYDSSTYYFEKAGDIYLRFLRGTTAGLPAEASAQAGGVESRATNKSDSLATLCREQYIRCLYQTGYNYALQASYTKALQYANKALQTGLQMLGEDYKHVATTYVVLGIIYNYMGEYDKSLKHYEKAAKNQISMVGKNHPSVATSYNNMGVVYHNKGDYDEAMMYYKRALSIQLDTLGPDHPMTATSYNNMGNVYADKGDYDEAMMYHKRALSIRVKTLGPNHPRVAASYNNMGTVFDEKGDYDKAMMYHKRALSIRVKTFSAGHPLVATSYNNMGLVCAAKGGYDDAIRYHQKSISIKLKTLGASHPDMAMSYTNIGSVYRDLKEYEKAVEYQYKALTIYKNTFADFHPDVGMVYNSIASIYYGKWEMGNEKWKKKNKEIEENLHLPTFSDGHPLGVTSSIKHFTYLDTALYYYQKAIGALVAPSPELRKQGIGTHYKSIYENPVIPTIYDVKEGRNTINSNVVLKDALIGKAEAFEKRWYFKNQ